MDIKSFELPAELKPVFTRALKLEWITFCYLLSVVIVMYLVMGTSQAMKSATLEDMLSIIPCVSFLIGARYYDRKPDETFPYGYHRVFGIAFLAGALALFAMGLYIVIDSLITLLSGEHATIGSTVIFGRQIWMGWVMILALLYSAVPAMVLGYKKLPLSVKLHNKILYTDADTQKADYLTAIAAMLGIVGIGMGIWWADAATAIFIGGSVLKDGFTQLKTAVLDLMDRHPVHTDTGEKEELVEQLTYFIKDWDWVRDAAVRLREHGQVFFCEVFIVPDTEGDLCPRAEKAIEDIKQVDWKLHEVVVSMVVNVPHWK